MAVPPRVLIPLSVADATYIMAVPVSADGTKVTGTPLKLASLTDNVTRVSASLNGRIAFSVSAYTSHIWGLPIDGKGHAAGEPQQLTYGSAVDVRPALSRDGQRVAFISRRANGGRLFYRDIAIGGEKELSTEGYRYDTPVFNRDGTGVMYVQYPDPGSWRDFIYHVPLSNGLPKKIWDKATWSWLWDWAPDGKTLLLTTKDDRSGKPMNEPIRQLDLGTLATTMFLSPTITLQGNGCTRARQFIAANGGSDSQSLLNRSSRERANAFESGDDFVITTAHIGRSYPSGSEAI